MQDQEMEKDGENKVDVHFTDQRNALIVYKVHESLFVDDQLKTYLRARKRLRQRGEVLRQKGKRKKKNTLEWIAYIAVPIMHLKTVKCNQNCLIATLADMEVFDNPESQESFQALFHSFDAEATFQYFKSFRRVRVNFASPLAAAEARAGLNKSEFNGKEMRVHFAQSVHIGSARLEPPKPDKQFLISPPASPPVGWEQALDATPVINYDLLCAISKLGPGEKYELHTGTPTTPSVVVHVCENEQESSNSEDDEGRTPRPKIIQTRRPDYTPAVLN